MNHYLRIFIRAAAAAAIGLHALAGAAQDAPDGRAGDAWTYLRDNGTTYTEWISEANPGVYTVVDATIPTQRDPALEPTYLLEGKLQEPRRVVFPLRVGSAWKASYRVKAGLAWRHETATRQVTDMAPVKVAAGEFDAYRIDAKVRFVRDEPSYLSWGMASGLKEETYWYAPAVKRIVKYESATLLQSIGGDFLERDGYQLAAFHLPVAPAWSPLPDGTWPVSMASADGRASAYDLKVKDQRAVWQETQTGIPGCQRLAAPVAFKQTAEGALMRVMRSLASENCSDLHFHLIRTPGGTWNGTGVATGALTIGAAR